MSEPDSADEICSICGKPMLDGQARYTAGEHRGIFRHWDCYEPELNKIEAVTKTLFDDTKSYAIRKRRARDGKGPVARKIGRMLAEAVKRELQLDIDPENFVFWVQPPSYRGPRWDLAVWGAHIQHPEHSNLKLMFHSWDTMTKLSKCSTLSLAHEGTYGTFDVGEGEK